MSSQRPQNEENVDSQAFNYLKYLPQQQSFNSVSGGFQNIDTQLNSQLQGRFNKADMLKQGGPMITNPLVDQKNAMQTQNILNTFPTQGQYQSMRHPLDNLQNAFNFLPHQQQDFSQFRSDPKLLQGDMFNQPFQEQNIGLNQSVMTSQPQLLLMELLRQQQQQQQSSTMNQGAQPQIFGSGFMGAAQLLANSQQNSQPINQILQSQSSQNNFDSKMPSPITKDSNIAYINQLYQNVNQYQQQIDQIEKKNNFQQPLHQYNTVQHTSAARSGSTQSVNFNNQQFQTLQQQDFNRFAQSNHHQYQKQTSAPLPDHQHFLYRSSYENDNKNAFNYEPKAYNPNQYSQQERVYSPENQQTSDYLQVDFKQKNAPISNSKVDKNIYSPPNQNFRYASDPVNESITMHNYNDFKQITGNSPTKYSSEKHLEVPDITYKNQHNLSQSSTQILQEQNNMLNISHNMNYNNHSPAPSNKNYNQGEEENYHNTSMRSRQSQRNKPANVDEIQIKPSTFEELLAKELASQPQTSASQSKVNQSGEKKEFLKRKSSQTKVQTQPLKKYNYYSDNFFEGGKKEQEYVPAPVKQEVVKKKPQEPKKLTILEDQRPLQMPKEQPELAKFDNEKPVIKKPFLKRGLGTAGGRKGYETMKNKQESDQKEITKNIQQTPNIKLPKTEINVDDFTSVTQQNIKSPKSSNATFSKEVKNKLKPEEFSQKEQLRNSMAEFEQLEQECIEKYSPDIKLAKKETNKNKKKKKIFDSDSEEDNYEQSLKDYQNQEAPEVSYQLEEDQKQIGQDEQNDEIPKSSLVRKYFHKEDLTKKPQVQKGIVEDQSAISEQMQQVVNQKLEQLDKAIEKYNLENDKVSKLKKEYEQLVQKAKMNQREIDTKKKKDLEDLEKMKNDEYEKLKKEKKILEQRQKNLQLVNTSNKKEREEIEFLKKELNRVTEETQVDDLQAKNKDLTEELKHMREVVILSQNTVNNEKKQQVKEQQQNKQQIQPPRYTFSNQNLQQEQQQQQQQKQEIKGILKKGNEKQQQVHTPVQDANQEDDQEEEVLSEDEKQDTHELNNEQGKDLEEEEEEEEDYDMKFPKEYHNRDPRNVKVVEQNIGQDGKITRLYENGKREVIFNNGVKRETFQDGYTIVYFNNNDIKQTYPDQKVVYYFAEAKTTQSTFPDGLQVFKFTNDQVEKHFPDGTKEIIFPDGTIKCIFADGEEESIFPDGTIQRIEKNGIKAIEFSNGQKDILFPDGTKIREFPDGRIRKTYPDGTQENTFRQQ